MSQAPPKTLNETRPDHFGSPVTGGQVGPMDFLFPAPTARSSTAQFHWNKTVTKPNADETAGNGAKAGT